MAGVLILVADDQYNLQASGRTITVGLITVAKDLKVSVLFDNETVGLKQLLVAFAGLEKDFGDSA